VNGMQPSPHMGVQRISMLSAVTKARGILLSDCFYLYHLQLVDHTIHLQFYECLQPQVQILRIILFMCEAQIINIGCNSTSISHLWAKQYLDEWCKVNFE